MEKVKAVEWSKVTKSVLKCLPLKSLYSNEYFHYLKFKKKNWTKHICESTHFKSDPNPF